MIVLLVDDKNSDDYEPGGPRKRGKPSATRALGIVESTKGTRRSSRTRAQQNIKSKSKAAGRGAERLASTTARGVYPRSPLGLSVSRGSMGALGHGQPSWVVGREQVETGRDMGSSAQQQIVSQENAEDVDDLREISRTLTERHRSMLLTTQAERERGGVRSIKCKLCPDVPFSSWATFRRHCKECEMHPVEPLYCDWCGDYYARGDSKKRHQNSKEDACRTTSHDKVMEKREKVGRLFKAFEARLAQCLESREKIEPTFSQAATRLLANICDDTSKKVTNKEEISFEGTWADGLCQ